MDEPQRFRAILAAIMVAAAASDARAAEPAAIGQTPVERMIDLNRKAFTDIQKQHFQAAKYWLTEALVISETAGLENEEMTARTYVHLAVMYLTGFGNRAEAIRYFTLGLKINPNITISPGLETPALKSAYLEAREDMGLPPNPDATATAVPGRRTAAPPPAVSHVPPTTPIREMGPADPDLPARVPAPLYCSVPFEVPAEQDLLVRCLTQKQQKRSSATLYFRADAATTKYAALPMAHSPKGWLIAVIPGHQIRGRSLAYFVKAQLPGSAALLYSGYPEAPNALLIKAAPMAAEDTVASTDRPRAPAARSGAPVQERPVGSVWLALTGGMGAAYHGRDAVDTGTHALGSTNPVYVESGFSPATVLQLEPEIGYQLGPRLSLSLLLRYQYAPASGDAFAPADGQHAILTSAVAGFVRAQLLLAGGGRFQPYFSGGAGVGRSFLAVVGKQCAANQCGLDHSDTLHGGPVGLTAGLGLIYRFSPRFALLVDVKEIVTLPKAMALTEFALGFEIAHDFHAPAAPARAPNQDLVASR